ncbi:MAG: hypothetical protein LC104_16285 [Bacteroidales bacterium]|nr:hypothetical protein [Bacteroidales bacterium]
MKIETRRPTRGVSDGGPRVRFGKVRRNAPEIATPATQPLRVKVRREVEPSSADSLACNGL